MDGLRRVELGTLLNWGPRLGSLLTPGVAPPVEGANGAALTLLSSRQELWEAASVAVAFASQTDADPVDVLTALGASAERQWPDRLSEAAVSLVDEDNTRLLSNSGFAYWAADYATAPLLTSTAGIVSASRVISYALPSDLIRTSSIAMGNLDVCVEICKGQPPTCLVQCLESTP